MIYADDALVLSDEAECIIRTKIGKDFAVKKGSIGPPTKCLGKSARKVLLDNISEVWTFSSSQHVRAAAGNVEIYLKKKGLSFPKSCDSPLPTSCSPELDATP